MQEKQVKEITVKELTETADMNRGTFYLYYSDVFDMVQKIEDSLFETLDQIITRHEQETVAGEMTPILGELFRFVGDNREMCGVLLSPNGDMNFLHRLNEVLREKFLKYWRNTRPARSADAFDYHYSFVIFGVAGIIRAWVGRNCPETPEQMASMVSAMILRGETPA